MISSQRSVSFSFDGHEISDGRSLAGASTVDRSGQDFEEDSISTYSRVSNVSAPSALRKAKYSVFPLPRADVDDGDKDSTFHTDFHSIPRSTTDLELQYRRPKPLYRTRSNPRAYKSSGKHEFPCIAHSLSDMDVSLRRPKSKASPCLIPSIRESLSDMDESLSNNYNHRSVSRKRNPTIPAENDRKFKISSDITNEECDSSIKAGQSGKRNPVEESNDCLIPRSVIVPVGPGGEISQVFMPSDSTIDDHNIGSILMRSKRRIIPFKYWTERFWLYSETGKIHFFKSLEDCKSYQDASVKKSKKERLIKLSLDFDEVRKNDEETNCLDNQKQDQTESQGIEVDKVSNSEKEKKTKEVKYYANIVKSKPYHRKRLVIHYFKLEKQTNLRTREIAKFGSKDMGQINQFRGVVEWCSNKPFKNVTDYQIKSYNSIETISCTTSFSPPRNNTMKNHRARRPGTTSSVRSHKSELGCIYENNSICGDDDFSIGPPGQYITKSKSFTK